MAGESPDDLDARRLAGLGEVGAHVAEAFARPVPPIVPRGDPPSRSQRPMSDAVTNGQYRELKTDVDNLKTNFSAWREEIDERFREQSTEARERHREMLERFDKQATATESSKPTLEKAATVVFGAISVVLTLVWGYSTLTQSAITDKIAATNASITREQKNVSDDVGRIEKSIGVLTDAFAKRADKVDDRFSKFVDDTVPRHELDFRLGREEMATADLAKTVTQNLVPRTEFEKRVEVLREDIRTLKDDTLKRADIDGRFNDFTKRMDLISNRVEQLQATSAGTAILQEQLREAQSQIKELRDHWLSAASK